MYNEDIDGSIAHVTMLGKQGIVSNEEKIRSSQVWKKSARRLRKERSCLP